MKQNRVQVARKYAKALFEVANEKSELATIFLEMTALSTVISENEKLVSALSGKNLSTQDKKDLLETLKKPFSATMQDFLSLLSDYNRLDTLPIIISDFIQLYDENQGIIEVEVTSTYKLADDQLSAMKNSLKKRYKANDVNITNKIDDEIMGGVILRVGNEIIDGSVKKKLFNIKKLLLQK